MTRLILGNVDIPYSHDPGEIKEKKKKIGRHRNAPRKPKAEGEKESISTGDVAEFLENKYHPYRIFVELHEEEIAKDIVDSIEGAFETFLQSGKIPESAFKSAESSIETRFKKFLTGKEMERIGYPGVPTKAALHGVNHRLKHPYRKRAPRPSFIDTGLYQSTSAAEIKE